jgi:DNA-binding transcriptional MocR family regulator
MRIRIEKASAQPIYLQVASAVREAIHSGALSNGAKLPSTRSLAEQIGVHRNTIVEAYRHLERDGLVGSSVGAGTFVVSPEHPPQGLGDQVQAAALPFSWTRLLRNASALDEDPGRWLSPRGLDLPKGLIQLTGALADSRQFPVADFAACMRAVLSEGDPQMLDYGPPEGYEPLRAWVTEWLGNLGVVDLDPERVFIVSGSQQGLDLLAKLLLAPGDAVLLEAPTYTAAFVALRQAEARLITIPVDDEGLSLQALEEQLDREPAKFLYTMPCFQNPTGVSLSPSRRTELLRIARARRLAIVEDHFDSDLHYWGEPPRPLLADDPEGQVIHLGTFSKMLFPGLRLGWMVVPREISELVRRLRWATDLSSATLTQRAMNCFCRRGYVQRHLKRLRRINGKRLKAMLSALEEEFPSQAHWTRPSGGMMLWCELPDAVDTLELFHEAARRGVLFSPGVAFFPNGGGRSAMRLSFNRESEARIRRGIRILGEMIKERLRAHGKARQGLGDRVPFL